jgi:hypothetical protein
MKKAIFLFVSVVLLLVVACKKKDSTPVLHYTRITNIYDDSSHDGTLYLYSPTQLISGDYDDSGKYHYFYSYVNGQSITEVMLNGVPAYSVYYIWDSLSRVDTSNVLSSTGGVSIRKKYSYNSSNFLTGVKWYNDYNELVLNESFTITNGNITQHTYSVLDSTNTSLPGGTYTYTYYSGMTNTLNNLNFGEPYLGASSANPVKSVTYVNGSTTTVTDYAYHYSGGNISSQLVYADSSGVMTTRVDSIAYQYFIQ